MLSNLHTHTTFCDGKNTPEETVISAIKNGFDSLGFSSHGCTPFDVSYCMTDTEGYIREIIRLKEKYKKDIQIYLGAEEDCLSLVERNKFDYIIGSSHYIKTQFGYSPIDYTFDLIKECTKKLGGSPLKTAELYFSVFCDYILKRKPDIIGHFDLITKFDEKNTPLFLENPEYNAMAEKYISKAAQAGCIFEINTGAISRGYRTAPYPAVNLIYTLKKENAAVTLSSDSHSADTLDYNFKEIKKMLKDIGFEYIYVYYGSKFVKERIE